MPSPIYYSKATTGDPDSTLIVAPRQGLLLPFNTIPNWLTLRIGMFASWTSSTGNNASAWTSTEDAASTAAIDWFAFGVKNNNSTLPGLLGSRFLGILSYTNYKARIATVSSRPTISSASTANVKYGSCIDSTVDFTASATLPSFPPPSASSSTSSYAAFIGLHIALLNAGAANQTAAIGRLTQGSDVSDTSSNALLTRIGEAVNTPVELGAVFNTGGAAVPRPDAIFVRLPFTGHRLRIHSIGWIAYEN